MKIDLFKLNNYNHLDVDGFVEFPEELYKNLDVRDIKDTKVTGEILINMEDEILLNLLVRGVFIMPCAVTLEDVPCDFEVNIEENIGKFNDFYKIPQNTLDILPFIWENIVSEVPIRVVKEGVKREFTHGNGWELISEE